MKPLTLGYSPCPNDTFIFHALVHGLVSSDQVSFASPLLEDVETLNNWAVKGRLDVTKISFNAMGHVLDDYCVLSAGSALGRGCGPLLITAKEMDLAAVGTARVAIPGRLTTAALLFRMLVPECSQLVEMRFDTIMEAVKSGEVDAGVIIHESRFTYQEQGLICIQDLGQWWENVSGHPIPLGCIAARRTLGREKIAAMEGLIRASILWARENPDASLSYIRQHARELESSVVQDHIGLYVNDFSLDLGDEGLGAIKAFWQHGRKAGVLPPSSETTMIDS